MYRVYIMNLGYQLFFLLTILEACIAYSPAANPPMLTHASMDVGNIISIVIPESPDENINIDQLTGEFRQQLERIKKQSRASKVEHGLVTLKRVLPEMSREEKRKTLPLIRRVLHGRRVSNPTISRNWTREARMDQFKDVGSFRVPPGHLEDKRMHRDYEEMGNREASSRRNDRLSLNREDNRHIRERPYANRRDESLKREDQILQDDQIGRENLIRRSDNIRPDESIQREKTDRSIFTEEDFGSAKNLRPIQDWKTPSWDDQNRGDTRVYPETSTIDCDYKLDRSIRQKEPGNEIVQSEKFDKAGRLVEIGIGNVCDEMNADCLKFNSQLSPLYPPARQDSTDNGKRHAKDFRSLELGDAPRYISFPRDFDVNAAINPNCNDIKKNHSGQSIKDDSSIYKLQGATNFESEDYRGSQKIVQDLREQTERLNASGVENLGSESLYNYAMKKNRGNGYDSRGVPSVQSGDPWNVPSFVDQQPINSSDETRESPNVYEMFGEKAIIPGVSYVQTEQGAYRRNIHNDRKTQGARSTLSYGNDGLPPRIQRATNVTTRNKDIPKLSSVNTIFERLKRLFRAPEFPVLSYNRIILVYGDEGESLDKKNHQTNTEADKSQIASSPSILTMEAEPSSSTSRDSPGSNQTIMDSSGILRTESIDPTEILPTVPTI